MSRFWPPPQNRLEKASKIDETWVSFSDLGRGQFDLGAEWSSGVRAVRTTLQAWGCSLARTRARRSASQTRSSHRKRWSADYNAPQARHRRPPLTGSGTGGLKGRKQGRENNGICAGPDRRLYCAPRGASTVLVVDPKTDKLSFIRRPKDGQAKLH